MFSCLIEIMFVLLGCSDAFEILGRDQNFLKIGSDLSRSCNIGDVLTFSCFIELKRHKDMKLEHKLIIEVPMVERSSRTLIVGAGGGIVLSTFSLS